MWREYREVLTDNQRPYRLQHITMVDSCVRPASVQPDRYLDLLHKDTRTGILAQDEISNGKCFWKGNGG